MKTSLHVHFNGDCEAAFRFYERSLGGKIEMIVPYEGTPGADRVPAEWGKKVMHARLDLGGQVLMGCDAPPECFQKAQGFSVSLNVEDLGEADRIFGELSRDGRVRMPIQETFWAQRFGMTVDRFGIPWMVNCEKAVADFTPKEELQAMGA